MLKKITNSFLLAFHNIRSHFFHTILSLLGIVIGVASLVSILSLIDGMEKYAQEQITTTTSLKAIVIKTELHKNINGVSIRKDSISLINFSDFQKLQASLSRPATGYLFHRQAKNISYDTAKTACYVTGTINLDSTAVVLYGRKFTDRDIELKVKRAILTEALAKTFSKEPLDRLVGKNILLDDETLEIIGIVRSKRAQDAELFYPITLISHSVLKDSPPQIVFEANHIADVQTLKTDIDGWLKTRFPGQSDFSIITNEFRVQQAAQGFLLFRIIMGLIVGISVLVGGIGVMNVLLISVTERTAEIGVRKAVGATRQDIVLQFLSESITISCFGSFVGTVFGTLATMIIIPIIRSLTGAPFQAAFTMNTLLIISVLAVVVGVVFGTYPALRASRLDPVEAIRRE